MSGTKKEMKTAIGIDLGGTNVKGVLLNEKGEILEIHHIPTQDDPNGKWKENVLEMARFLQNCEKGEGNLIGLSAPGLCNETNSCIAHLPNRLPGLENFIWQNYFGADTFVINDAHAALMAEAKFGEIKGFKNAVILTLGTGVGGGILIDGKLYQGLSQMAGHLGHMAINVADDDLSILGMPGSLEYAFGNYSIEKRSNGVFRSTHDLLEAYRRKEAFATWLWLDSVRKLAIGMVSLINALSPEIIVLSGGITLAESDLFEPLEEFLNIYEFRPKNKKTIIKKACFSDLSGAIGAAAFAMDNKMN